MKRFLSLLLLGTLALSALGQTLQRFPVSRLISIPAAADTTAPTITITTPTPPTYTAGATPLTTLAGTASDNVALSSVTWSNSLGGSGTATGTTSWSVPSIALSNGSNVITVTATDTSSNTNTATITVSYSAGGESLAYEAASSNYGTGSTNTFSHTLSGSATKRYVLVALTPIWYGDVTPLTVTFDGLSMTLINDYQYDSVNNRVMLYGLALGSKAAGTYSVVVTATSGYNIAAATTSFVGVNQTTPLGTPVQTGSYSTAGGATISSATGELVYDVIADETGIVITNSGSQTQRANLTSLAVGTIPGASSVTTAWTLASSIRWGEITVALKP